MSTLLRMVVLQDWAPNAWTVLLLAAEILAILTLPSVLLQRRGQPLGALSWVLALVALPFAGVFAWWGIGRSHLKRKRRQKVKARGEIRSSIESARLRDGVRPIPFSARPLPLPDADGVFASVGGNRVELLTDGRAAFAEMERMITGAKRDIHLLFYAWHTDEMGTRFRDLLVQKARRGVKVRLLLDALGSGRTSGRFMDPLREAGGKVALFSPTRYLRRSLAINFRNHRKILVADGSTAYTGGFNIGDDYAWKWRDAGLLLQGPVVAQLQEIFTEDWYFSTRESLAGSFRPVREGDAGDPDRAPGDAVCAMVAGGPDTENNVTQDAFFLTVSSAQERIWITTPYLIPTAPIQTVLRAAVHRGVDVRVLIPQTSDQWFTAMAGRSYYPSLIASGVKLFEFGPAMIHAKVWVVDRGISIVGSANLDTRSFKLNFETSCFVKSGEVNALLAGLFQAQLLEGREVTAEDLKMRGYWTELAEAAMNLFSPLL